MWPIEHAPNEPGIQIFRPVPLAPQRIDKGKQTLNVDELLWYDLPAGSKSKLNTALAHSPEEHTHIRQELRHRVLSRSCIRDDKRSAAYRALPRPSA